MSRVQIAHRRHEADACACALPFFGEPLHRGDGRNDLHDGKLTTIHQTNKPRGLLHAARTIQNFLVARSKIQRLAFRHFVGAWLVDRRVGRAVVGRHDVVRKHPGLDFLAADVGQHVTVDLDARAQHLAALLDHFLALQRVVDDVAVLERQVVFAQHGADALAPAAGRFQIGNNLWFVHDKTMPHSKGQGKYFRRSLPR